MATITPLHRDPLSGTQPRTGVEVVAVILSDGSLLEVPRSPRDRPGTHGTAELANGRIAGSNWTLWWERRVFAPGPATAAG
jgi:hypothetical protein